MRISKEVSDLLPRLTALRQELHAIPEVGFEELETQRYVLDRLAECCPDKLERIAGTGVRAVWFGQEEGDAIALRADMDGLSTEEKTDADYSSRHPGRMHGCGHDGHMAMLLGAAALLAAHRPRLKRTVTLLFQPAEEGRCGASRMIAEGALEEPRVERIYGLHLWPDVPKGRFGIRWGVQMAHSCEFDIVAKGRSAHGASPQMGVDAVVASAELITMLQSAITRSVDPHKDALLTIGRIQGGTARNIIADRVEMNATLRALDSGVYDDLLSRIHAMADGVAIATGADFEITERMQYPSVNNPRPLVEELYTYLDDMEDVLLVEPAMAAEDFACYQRERPGVFIFLGVGGGKNKYPLHNCRFDFDEDALLPGVELYKRLMGI